jgi:hypothetical protein
VARDLPILPALATRSPAWRGPQRNKIDGCLTLASRHSHTRRSADLAIADAELAMKLTTTLDKTLDATVTIYAQACGKLADHACVAEELDTLPAACEHHLSAVALAAHAQSLTN